MALRPDVRRFETSYDSFCHACERRHVRAGELVVWHGQGQGVSSVSCFERETEVERLRREAPLFADEWTREAQAVAETQAEREARFREEQPGAWAEAQQAAEELERPRGRFIPRWRLRA